MRDRKSDRHRAIGAAKMGRALTSSEVVHHQDENKANNGSANLAVESRSSHTTHHNKTRPVARLKRMLQGKVKAY